LNWRSFNEAKLLRSFFLVDRWRFNWFKFDSHPVTRPTLHLNGPSKSIQRSTHMEWPFWPPQRFLITMWSGHCPIRCFQLRNSCRLHKTRSGLRLATDYQFSRRLLVCEHLASKVIWL
jgi:hypothetical protein